MSLVPFRKHDTTIHHGLDDFDRIFDNLFKNALTNMNTPAAPAGNLSLRMDVSETNQGYHIQAEIPGLEEKDIEITLKDGVLSITGEKLQEIDSDNKSFHRIERSYGHFKRNLQLPSDVDEENIEAHVKNGLLCIDIGKIKEATKQTKHIKIKRK